MSAYSCNVCGQGFEGRGCNCDSLPDDPPDFNGKTRSEMQQIMTEVYRMMDQGYTTALHLTEDQFEAVFLALQIGMEQ